MGVTVYPGVVTNTTQVFLQNHYSNYSIQNDSGSPGDVIVHYFNDQNTEIGTYAINPGCSISDGAGALQFNKFSIECGVDITAHYRVF